MRRLISLVESPSDDVLDAIDRAAFDEYEIDNGTAGLCAMFALALYRVFLDRRPTLILVGGMRDGKRVMAQDGGLWWAHAAVMINQTYYDIEGRQQPEWMIDNYAWSIDPMGAKGISGALLEVSQEEFWREVRTCHTATCRKFYLLCRDRLQAARQASTTEA